MRIGIITDNTCNLNAKEIEELGVHIVSLYINRKGTYTKSTELDLDAYYEELSTATELPTTSQPSPQDFIQVFEKAVAEFDALIVPVLSGKLSGTFVSASIAARDFDKPIHVVDTLLACDGVGLLIKNLVKKIEAGTAVEILVKYATDFHKHVRTVFSVDDLNYLHKGGRIGKAKALMGNLLKMKPIIQLDEGELKPVENIRGNKKLLQAMVDATFKDKDLKKMKQVVILSIRRESDAREIEGLIKQKAPDVHLDIRTIEPVIGTHLGPQGLGIISEWA
jgi:DegV family protein with EDD domain